VLLTQCLIPLHTLIDPLSRCPPCRGFTPILGVAYEEMQSEGSNEVEVVFLSSDSDEASFNGYFKDMPWVSVPFADRAIKDAASAALGVRGIPTLVVFEVATGKVVDDKARATVTTHKKLTGVFHA